jgi:hypothetical protein
MPLRVTVPVSVVPAEGEFDEAVTPLVDTRRARRAYLAIDLVAEPDDVTVTVIGRTSTSLDTFNLLGATPELEGAGYLQTHIVPAGSQFPLIPLGFKSIIGDDSRPHVLLDAARVNLGGTFSAVAAYYVLEY